MFISEDVYFHQIYFEWRTNWGGGEVSWLVAASNALEFCSFIVCDWSHTCLPVCIIFHRITSLLHHMCKVMSYLSFYVCVKWCHHCVMCHIKGDTINSLYAEFEAMKVRRYAILCSTSSLCSDQLPTYSHVARTELVSTFQYGAEWKCISAFFVCVL